MSSNKTKSSGLRSVRPTCQICNMPERRDVEQAREQGISYSVLTKYLQQKRGYETINDDHVRNHFKRKH